MQAAQQQLSCLARLFCSDGMGVAADKDDNIYVSDMHTSFIIKSSKGGNLIKVVGCKGTLPREVDSPSFIKVINDTICV